LTNNQPTGFNYDAAGNTLTGGYVYDAAEPGDTGTRGNPGTDGTFPNLWPGSLISFIVSQPELASQT
jgi:hypothetical protein